MERNVAQEIKVGSVVLAILLLAGAAIFLLGGSTDLLENRYRLYASYKDISGLREGAAVRLAGIDVGEVTNIQFPTDPGRKRVIIQLNLMERYQVRIRKDSVASIQTEGVLGDKYISISVGSSDEPLLLHGDWIETNEPLEFLSYMKKATEILDNSAGISRKVNFMLGEDQDSARASLANAIVTLETLVKQVEVGRGLLHNLLYDEHMAANVRGTVENLELASANLRHMTEELQQGEGFAHELIYGSEGERLARELGDLANALQTLTSDIENEESLVHSLLYDPERADMVEELHATATSLREVARSIEQGEGTLGMLARDPTLYEDLRSLVGGAQRNKLLRSYIRRTIEKSEDRDASPPAPAE